MPASVAEFAKAAEDSGILTAESLVEYFQGVAPDMDAAALANRLVKDGRLTPFQAKYIYGGKANSLVLGPYVVLDMLGKGGMGYVYKAEHRKMRRVVALKVIARNALKSPAAIQRFEREVQAAARLEHPNIVAAFDAGEAAGTHYLVMQFVDGRNLSEVVKELGPQPVGRAVDWILQAATGLAFAHEEGVIHRDIKPGNMLVGQDGVLKILDMGLARLATLDAEQDQLTGTGQIMGTVDYMAPEQAIDMRQADARSDIYSLGVTLWYLLTGRPLFAGETAMARMVAHMQTPAPALNSVRPDISAELDLVFQRMVAKEPADRFQSLREVIAALRALAISETEAGPRSLSLHVGHTAPESLALAATQTLQQPKAVAVHQSTARLSAVDIDTAVGLKRASAKTQQPTVRVKTVTLALGGGAAGAVLVIGLMILSYSGRRYAEPTGEVVNSAKAPSAHQVSRIVNAATTPDEIQEPDDQSGLPLDSSAQSPSNELPPPSLIAPTSNLAAVNPAQSRQGVDASPGPVSIEAKPSSPQSPALGPTVDIASDMPAKSPPEDQPSKAMRDGDGEHEKNTTADGARPPIALDADQVGLLLAELISKRAAVQAEAAATMALITPRRTRSEHLRQQIAAGEQAINAKTQQIVNLQRIRGNREFAAEKEAQISVLANDINILRTAIQPLVQEQVDLLQQIATYVARLDVSIKQAAVSYPQWQVVLSPFGLHYDTKSAYLTEAVGQHPDIPEFSLWLAWLLWHGGDEDAAVRTLTNVWRLLSAPAAIAPPEILADFVYMSLTIEPQELATSRLVVLKKQFPKYQRIPYLEAMDRIRKKQWPSAKEKFLAALRRDGAEKDVDLNSDAALFFACAPVPALQDEERAAECISQVVARLPKGTCNSLRAQAALHASADEWDKALECLRKAAPAAAKPLVDGIKDQEECYENKEIYTLEK